jgi:hypothetical protein
VVQKALDEISERPFAKDFDIELVFGRRPLGKKYDGFSSQRLRQLNLEWLSNKSAAEDRNRDMYTCTIDKKLVDMQLPRK